MEFVYNWGSCHFGGIYYLFAKCLAPRQRNHSGQRTPENIY